MDPQTVDNQNNSQISPPPLDPSSVSAQPANPDNKRFIIIIIFAALLAILIPTTVLVISKNRQQKNETGQIPKQESIAPACNAVTITDTLNQVLTADQLSLLRPFDEVKIAISAPNSSLDKARFRVNGSTWQEVTIKENGAFIGNYILPEGIAKFTIEAEVHDPTSGWL